MINNPININRHKAACRQIQNDNASYIECHGLRLLLSEEGRDKAVCRQICGERGNCYTECRGHVRLLQQQEIEKEEGEEAAISSITPDAADKELQCHDECHPGGCDFICTSGGGGVVLDLPRPGPNKEVTPTNAVVSKEDKGDVDDKAGGCKQVCEGNDCFTECQGGVRFFV